MTTIILIVLIALYMVKTEFFFKLCLLVTNPFVKIDTFFKTSPNMKKYPVDSLTVAFLFFIVSNMLGIPFILNGIVFVCLICFRDLSRLIFRSVVLKILSLLIVLNRFSLKQVEHLKGKAEPESPHVRALKKLLFESWKDMKDTDLEMRIEQNKCMPRNRVLFHDH